MSEETQPNNSGAADPEKVHARIQKLLANTNSSEKEKIPLDIDPDVLNRITKKDKGRTDPEPEQETADVKDPDRGRESKAFEMSTPENSGIKAWALQMPDLSREQVTPTQLDKSVYLKAMLHDTPVEFKIALPACKLSMRIRSLNNYEQDIVFKALDMDQKDADIAGPAQYVTRLQYYSGLLQITEFNSEKLSYPFYLPGVDFETTSAAAQDLRKRAAHFIGGNNWATWQVKLTGLRIFEEKLGQCNRAVIDENFWTPAGTD
jgi:hypothetical protein